VEYSVGCFIFYKNYEKEVWGMVFQMGEVKAKKRLEEFRISKDLLDSIVKYCQANGKTVEQVLNEVMDGIVRESGLGSEGDKGKVLVKDFAIKIAVPVGLDRKLVSVANGKKMTKFMLVRERLRELVGMGRV
jgi:hypothetical protein